MCWRGWTLVLATVAAMAALVPGPAEAQAAPEPTPAAVAASAPASPPVVNAAAPEEPPDTAALTAAAQALQAITLATVNVLEGTQRSARSSAEWLARGVDGWFGDIPFAQGGKVTDGRMSLGWRWRQDAGHRVDLRFSARFRMPNVERRGYLFIGREDPREVLRDTPDTVLNQQQLWTANRGERSFIAGLGVTLRDVVDFRVGLRSSAKPYAQARVELPWSPAPGHELTFRETFFWTHGDRFGATTVLSYDLALSPVLALRWLNVATITQVTRNVDWSSTLGAYRAFSGQRLLSLEVLFSGTGTHGVGIGSSDRGLLAKWEQPVYQDWLSAEVLGGHFWPRPDATSERGRTWALGATLKMRF